MRHAKTIGVARRWLVLLAAGLGIATAAAMPALFADSAAASAPSSQATVAEANHRLAKKLAFAPGTWKGTGVFSGTFKLCGCVWHRSSNLKFDLKISRRGIASGVLTMEAAVEGKVQGADVDMKVVGNFTLSGTAADVRMNGTLQFIGTVTFAGVKSPLDVTSPIEGGRLEPKTATSTKVTGQSGSSGELGTSEFKWTAIRKS